MTQEAAEAVETIVSQSEMPESAVVRIAGAEGRSNGSGPAHELQLELVSAPQASDLVVQDMRIAVEPGSLPFLDDKVLDAAVADGRVEFSLYQQDEEPPAA